MTTTIIIGALAIGLAIGIALGRYMPIHRHDWGKWHHIKKVNTYSSENSTIPIKAEAVYARTCTTCGRVQTRKEKL